MGRRLPIGGSREMHGQVAFSPRRGEKVPKADEGRSRAELLQRESHARARRDAVLHRAWDRWPAWSWRRRRCRAVLRGGSWPGAAGPSSSRRQSSSTVMGNDVTTTRFTATGGPPAGLRAMTKRMPVLLFRGADRDRASRCTTDRPRAPAGTCGQRRAARRRSADVRPGARRRAPVCAGATARPAPSSGRRPGRAAPCPAATCFSGLGDHRLGVVHPVALRVDPRQRDPAVEILRVALRGALQHLRRFARPRPWPCGRDPGSVSARLSSGAFSSTNLVCSNTAIRLSRSRYACARSLRSWRLFGLRLHRGLELLHASGRRSAAARPCCCGSGRRCFR